MSFLKLIKSAYLINKIPERINFTIKTAFFQTKILQRSIIGFIHALGWWDFLNITLDISTKAFAKHSQVRTMEMPIFAYI